MNKKLHSVPITLKLTNSMFQEDARELLGIPDAFAQRIVSRFVVYIGSIKCRVFDIF